MQGNSHSFMNSYISWKASKKGIHVLHSGCTDQSAWVQLFPVLGAWADWLLFLGWSIRPEIPSSICSRWAGIICRSHRVMDSIMESILYPRLFFCNRNPVSRGTGRNPFSISHAVILRNLSLISAVYQFLHGWVSIRMSLNSYIS